MKTLATSLVTVQEISEHLKAGLALENMHGEYFYINDSWPKIIETSVESQENKNSSVYPPEIMKLIKQGDDQILRNNAPVGYIINSGTKEDESSCHLLLKFAINYTTGEPFCFCMLAKKVDDKSQFQLLLEKIKELLPLSSETEFKHLNHTYQHYQF